MLGLLVGCGSAAGLDAGALPDAGPDARAARDAGVDAGQDAGPLPCPEALSERRVALDRGTVRTQIHPAVAFDGEAIWVAYARPEEGTGLFDVYATRVACDGRPLLPPFGVSSAPEAGSDLDPDIVISEERILIAWQSDDQSGGPDNLHVRYRLFARDGTPMGEDRILHSRSMGAAVTGNHLGVKLAVRPDGGFVAAGSRALPDATRFSAYAQRIGAGGELEGDAVDPEVEPEVGQAAVAVDVAADATLWLSYDRLPDGEGSSVRIAAPPDRPPEAALQDPAFVSTGGSDVLAAAGSVWVALASETSAGTDLRLVDVAPPAAERRAVAFGDPARAEQLPRLARAPDGAMAVAFFRQIRGSSSELLIAPVAPPEAAGPPTVGPELRVDDRGTPSVYDPASTHVLDDYWFVAFPEGDSPDFRLIGRFVRLPRQ